MTLRRTPAFDLLDVKGRDQLGEGPWWSAADELLYWVDITGRLVRSARLDGTEESAIPAPCEVGFAVPDDTGAIIVGLRSGVHRLDPGSGTYELLADPGHAQHDHRINDGKTDRSGRLWFGTMHDQETEPSSGLYSFNGGRLQHVYSGIITSNGLGWSPDNSVFYHTDSITRTISAYDFDEESGSISRPRVFARDGGAYVPDGLTVDAEGFLWSAKWDGGIVVRYAPDGTVVDELELPVSRPTSCMFVGPGLRTLAVTSALPAHGLHEPLAGSVFLIDAGVAGLPESPATT
ncbi:SMP-30/gluconolactonase/LRE family protein [Arthrobacter sp. FW306-05-C]|uniref:SMP-30/gluconolactonase/LRE family protein n=1 Tax=Arthrobacter sp. FW306-05-C TaxID=2879620 RepID=UPI001F24C716|nr:SMP-30/gluconolactonase/LRE family protein [Arthrobacter sp. FW306-05-C]UKA66597.1 SMP-30/gluconolactonase/LRE family protein [Arthrobacter sp. FW306-05-C]